MNPFTESYVLMDNSAAPSEDWGGGIKIARMVRAKLSLPGNQPAGHVSSCCNGSNEGGLLLTGQAQLCSQRVFTPGVRG